MLLCEWKWYKIEFWLSTIKTDVVAVSRDETDEISIIKIDMVELLFNKYNSIKMESGRIILHMTVNAHGQFVDNL